jgi:hypothetical protein
LHTTWAFDKSPPPPSPWVTEYTVPLLNPFLTILSTFPTQSFHTNISRTSFTELYIFFAEVALIVVTVYCPIQIEIFLLKEYASRRLVNFFIYYACNSVPVNDSDCISVQEEDDEKEAIMVAIM